MADKLPPSRYRIVERDGRLVVIDTETGSAPPTAAERMAAHDQKLGFAEEARDQLADAVKDAALATGPAPATPAPPNPWAQAADTIGPDPRSAQPPQPRPVDRPAAANADKAKASRASQRPAGMPSRPAPSGGQSGRAAPAPGRARGELRSGGAQPLTTAAWWDAKGPRSIVLTPAGAAKLRAAFTQIFVIALVIFGVALVVAPLLVVAAVFLFTRFGRGVVARFGAQAIDTALREK